LNLKSRVRRSLHHAIIPSHYLRSHGGGFASLAFPFFRADQLTAILLSGLTIALIVARLGDDDSRSQHDHNNRADYTYCNFSYALTPLLTALSVIADRSMMVLCNSEWPALARVGQIKALTSPLNVLSAAATTRIQVL
jgi:hypothetical protein